MLRKRFSAAEVVNMLREAGVLIAQGQIALPIKVTKNDKAAVLSMNGLILESLLEMRRDDIKIADPVFDREPRLKIWKDDLARAESTYVDGLGRLADRKCLRKTFGTWLKDAGVALRDAQRLMPDQAPKLTAMIYTDPRMPVMQDAVNLLSAICQNENANGATSCNAVQRDKFA